MFMKLKNILLLTGIILATGVATAGLNDGLMAYYPFNGNANDASGNANNGTTHGEVALTQDHNGKTNSAYFFDGIDDYISVPDAPSLHPYDQLTISLWVRSDKNDFWIPILHKGGQQDGTDCYLNREYSVFVQPSWSVGGIEINSSGDVSPCEIYTNTSPITTGRWYFFTGVVDLHNHEVNAYLDGVLQGKITAPDNVIRSNSNELRIGQSEETAYPPFNGIIDEIRIYNRALSATEIQKLYSISFLTTKDQCKKDGWKAFDFKNQGECVSGFEHLIHNKQ
jgi:hypothetical protein